MRHGDGPLSLFEIPYLLSNGIAQYQLPFGVYCALQPGVSTDFEVVFFGYLVWMSGVSLAANFDIPTFACWV